MIKEFKKWFFCEKLDIHKPAKNSQQKYVIGGTFYTGYCVRCGAKIVRDSEETFWHTF